ncbi:MAG: RluA family pseudouridine synthase [Verrucomicrobiota bacterium]
MKIYSFTGEEMAAWRRLDQGLAELTGLSRMRIKKLFEEKVVFIDGQPATPRSIPSPDAEVELHVPDVKPSKLSSVKMDLDVLHEDDDFLVLNKAPGIAVHPGAGVKEATLVEGLMHHCQGQLSGIGGVERPGIVHRLDKDTSGILLVAKSDLAHRSFSAQFQARQVNKVYQAYLIGAPKWDRGKWTGSIGRHPVQRHKMAVVNHGRKALTDFLVLKRLKRVSFMELVLHTGRTHQIRVHSAAAGLPVVGDMTYGGAPDWVRKLQVQRQLLHATRLKINHPRTGSELEFSAPLPQDFEQFGSKMDEEH